MVKLSDYFMRWKKEIDENGESHTLIFEDYMKIDGKKVIMGDVEEIATVTIKGSNVLTLWESFKDDSTFDSPYMAKSHAKDMKKFIGDEVLKIEEA
jgi:hypothetical protein